MRKTCHILDCSGGGDLCRWLDGLEGVKSSLFEGVFDAIDFFLSHNFTRTLVSVALAQQSPETTGRPVGDTIGHPPPLAGPPPISEPSSTTQPAPVASMPRANEPAPKGYTRAYAPAGTPPTPYSTGPLPNVDTGPGLDRNGSTKTVRAVRCSTAAHQTDGFTTCARLT
jgi:hypothetical protein